MRLLESESGPVSLSRVLSSRKVLLSCGVLAALSFLLPRHELRSEAALTDGQQRKQLASLHDDLRLLVDLVAEDIFGRGEALLFSDDGSRVPVGGSTEWSVSTPPEFVRTRYLDGPAGKELRVVALERNQYPDLYRMYDQMRALDAGLPDHRVQQPTTIGSQLPESGVE